MEAGFLSVLLFGFIMGIKHAIEPDHIIAVSTIASQSKKIGRSALAGVFWGMGHTATLFILGITLILLKSEIPEVWAMSLEFLVGIMLVYLGIDSLVKIKKEKLHAHAHPHREGYVHTHFHSHRTSEAHEHGHKNIPYYKSAIIGFIHGLAGSAAMILLTMETVQTVWQAALYIVIFGLGTVCGMLLFTTVLAIPFVMSTRSTGIHFWLARVTGGISTCFGFYYMYQLGVVEGLFRLLIE